MGRERYPNARSLLITADGGGSNGSRVRLWKVELQKLADELSLTLANFERFIGRAEYGTSDRSRRSHERFRA